jgi:hypothetical protein
MPRILGSQRCQVLCRLVRGSVALLLTAVPVLAQNQLWMDQFGTTGHDSISGAADDGAGGVYVGGATTRSLGGQSAGNYDAWLSRYDNAGSRLWIRQFGTSEYDGINASSSDGSGGVFVSGWTEGDLGGPNAGGVDAWLAHYDSAGNRLWIRQLGTGALDALNSSAPDGSGGVYVSGYTLGALGASSAGDYDAWLARYDSSGTMLWIRQFGTPRRDLGYAAATDGSGGVYATGYTTNSSVPFFVGQCESWIARFDSSGSQLWIRHSATATNDIAWAAGPDESGGLYVGGLTIDPIVGTGTVLHDAWLARYDSAGNELWTRQFGTNRDYIYDIAPDGSGGAYATGFTIGDLSGPYHWDAWLARYDTAGNRLWFHRMKTSVFESGYAVASDGSGGVFVGGDTEGSLGGPNAGQYDVWLARYDGSCNSGETYCVASSTSIPGCQAAISAAGSPTLANPTAHKISSGSVPGANLGLLLFGGNGPASTFYGTLGGMLCVAGPTFRTTPKLSGGDQGQCNGSYSFTLQDLINASPIVVAGATINAQVWSRDPANADGFLLSDGLQFTVCP